ncbi:MAG: hypothetical protein U0795_20875 [Pirellulales bacterium]
MTDPRRTIWLAALACLLCPALTVFGQQPSAPAEPSHAQADDSIDDATRGAIRRAIGYLEDEVTRWPTENHCYACHHNGDAARALMIAARQGWPVDDRALKTSRPWLDRPNRWEEEGSKGEFYDRTLSSLQFSWGLNVAQQTTHDAPPESLAAAAKLVADTQTADGSWQIDAPGTAGSPVTYGPVLATVVGREVLIAAGDQFVNARRRADTWLAARHPQSVFDAATLLLIDTHGPSASESSPLSETLRDECLALVAKGQTAQGGWGPYVVSRAEPFDTALVVLGLQRQKSSSPDRSAAMIAAGRRHLVESQLADGSWPPTTRPPGANSHAQRISTTAWSLLALLP